MRNMLHFHSRQSYTSLQKHQPLTNHAVLISVLVCRFILYLAQIPNSNVWSYLCVFHSALLVSFLCSVRAKAWYGSASSPCRQMFSLPLLPAWFFLLAGGAGRWCCAEAPGVSALSAGSGSHTAASSPQTDRKNLNRG